MNLRFMLFLSDPDHSPIILNGNTQPNTCGGSKPLALLPYVVM